MGDMADMVNDDSEPTDGHERPCNHSWERADPTLERYSGPFIYRCDACRCYGWLKRSAHFPTEVRPYAVGGHALKELLARKGSEGLSAKPMSSRRGRNGGFVPGGTGGGR